MKGHLIKKIAILVFVFILVPSFLSTGTNFKTAKDEMILCYQAGVTEWKAPKFVDKLKNPLVEDAKATKEGKNLYNTNCASCHGDKGEGNGPAAAALNPKPKNLSSKQVQEQSDGALYWKITTGKPPMISWKSALSEKQRWSLVNYIRQLNKK
ncbi:MAG: cytochrome c [Ignavibacteriales bacterium]|nr:MAG: cytochrome c [Ignavibacteriales bacterium]